MDRTFTPEEMNKAVFINTVMMLASSTMQQLGKIINPATGKTGVDLDSAQATIDMLVMLQAKTKGNLDRDEERVLRDAVSTVQLNFVETAEAERAKQAASPSPAKPDVPSPEDGVPSAGPAASDSPAGEDKQTKFRKTYG